MEIWNCDWLQNLDLISNSTELAFSGDKFCFVSNGDVVLHQDAAPTKNCYYFSAVHLRNQQDLPVRVQLVSPPRTQEETIESITTYE